MALKTAGRTDVAELFRVSGILQSGKLKHTPFLAFVADGEDTVVKIIDQANGVRKLPRDTPLMVQWRGQWRSDFFQMTAGDVVDALDADQD